jgi:hypothetical protein
VFVINGQVRTGADQVLACPLSRVINALREDNESPVLGRPFRGGFAGRRNPGLKTWAVLLDHFVVKGISCLASSFSPSGSHPIFPTPQAQQSR